MNYLEYEKEKVDHLEEEYITTYGSTNDFEFLFDDAIIERGEEYYENEAVTNLLKEEDIYTATVYGTRSYDVKIVTKNDEIIDMECSCPYYMSNEDNCKHMYAVLKCIKNNEYVDKYSEPCICPACNSSDDIIPIVYGKITPIIEEKIKEDTVKYGGEEKQIKTYGDNNYYKKWYCNKCKVEILNTIQLEIPKSLKYIGDEVDVIIDRPLGSKHPKHGFIYSVNYGYIPNTISGDGEELDCYILGEFAPLEKFNGVCIAVIHRTDDDDDKLVVVKKGKYYTNSQIRALTEFQERFFKSEIIKDNEYIE